LIGFRSHGRKIALWGLLGLISQLSLAVEVRGMFRESAEVQNQSDSQRQAAAREALGRVLVRISGTGQVLKNGEVRAAMSRADRYLAQFSYQKNDVVDTADSFKLDMEFQPQAVLEILKQAQQPVWSSNRPAVLACVAAVQGSGNPLITAGSASSSALLQQAKRRGVPLQLPASRADCNDGANAELVLSGELRLNGGRCDSRWSLPLDGRDQQWSASGTSLEACVASAVDELAETLSATYAFATVVGASEPLLVRVSGIDDFSDYADVVLMLNSLAMVEAVDVAGVEGGAVDFSLTVGGSAGKLQQAIELKGMLIETAAPATTPSPVSEPPLAPEAAAPEAAAPEAAALPSNVLPVAGPLDRERRLPEQRLPERLYYRLASR
jgi:hypothetical protein